MVGFVPVGLLLVRLGKAGGARPVPAFSGVVGYCVARPGEAWRARSGPARSGLAGCFLAWRGRASCGGRGRASRGAVRSGWAGQGWHGWARRDWACYGVSRLGGLGRFEPLRGRAVKRARPGMFRCGRVWLLRQDGRGTARPGAALPGLAWRARFGLARPGGAGHGQEPARLGGRGPAWTGAMRRFGSGLAGMARRRLTRPGQAGIGRAGPEGRCFAWLR